MRTRLRLWPIGLNVARCQVRLTYQALRRAFVSPDVGRRWLPTWLPKRDVKFPDAEDFSAAASEVRTLCRAGHLRGNRRGLGPYAGPAFGAVMRGVGSGRDGHCGRQAQCGPGLRADDAVHGDVLALLPGHY